MRRAISKCSLTNLTILLVEHMTSANMQRDNKRSFSIAQNRDGSRVKAV